MIRCTNCGAVNPENALNCQNCMALLSVPASKGESGLGLRTNTQDQPELPAWLESLRAGDRPAAQPKNFSPEDMDEEGRVPSWMQTNRPNDGTHSSSYPSMRPAASSAPDTDEESVPVRNISANSLIDANALPTWMQPDKPQPPQQNIAASSLVQPEFMPDWMKSMQPSTQGQSSPPLPQREPPTQPSFPAQGFSAPQLIDAQSLPNWMLQEGGQNITPPTQQTPYPNFMGNGPTEQTGFAASSLLDMNSLPSWLRDSERGNLEQRPAQSQQSTWQAPTQQPMPQRGYEQQSWQAPQQPASSPAWQTPATPSHPAYPPVPGPQAPTQQGPRGTLSMGSLIDVNALPEWLRSANETPQSQQGQTGESGNQQPYPASNTANNYGSRPDNVRVPSRPRGEVGTNEGSEVAANVFSSMLGVASNAPQYPAQQQQGYPAYPNGQIVGNTPPFNQAPGMPNGYTPGQAGQQNYGQQGYANYSNSMQPGNYPGGPMGQNQGVPQMPTRGSNEKPAKKGGLFEAIRNFFFRQ
ncbi:MAG: hypothetical protein NVS4B12_25130 [Ktedonobacteraceae bacterium]